MKVTGFTSSGAQDPDDICSIVQDTLSWHTSTFALYKKIAPPPCEPLLFSVSISCHLVSIVRFLARFPPIQNTVSERLPRKQYPLRKGLKRLAKATSISNLLSPQFAGQCVEGSDILFLVRASGRLIIINSR